MEFEVADFLYRRNQMSGGDTDFIFHLWAASLAAHNDTPPFKNHAEMYETIDSTPVGDVPWESFTLEYDGVRPDGDTAPSVTYPVVNRPTDLTIHRAKWAIQAGLRFRCSHCQWIG